MTLALVTGVSGQDGRYLAQRLAADGVEVHGTIAEPDQIRDVDGVAEYHVVDLSRPGLGDLVRELGPELVFNLAAVSSVARSWTEPTLTAQVNGVAVAELLGAANDLVKAGRAIRVLQASSAEIFGEPATSPQTESTPIAPVSPYGAAKAYAHQLVAAYRKVGVWAASVILYNHESPLRPDGFVTRKITKAAARIARGRQAGLELGSLDIRRDWGWAPDYVDAMLRAIAADQPRDYIVASGVEHSIADFVRLAFKAAGIHDWASYVGVSEAFQRPNDPTSLVGDASLAREALGWAPTVSFEELVARMVEEDLRRIDQESEDE